MIVHILHRYDSQKNAWTVADFLCSLHPLVFNIGYTLYSMAILSNGKSRGLKQTGGYAGLEVDASGGSGYTWCTG